MKTMFALLLITVTAMNDAPQKKQIENQDLELQLSAEMVFEEKVKVYDYDGNLVEEALISDVANNTLSSSQSFSIEESDFAFSYLGDYYYFSDEVKTGEIN